MPDNTPEEWRLSELNQSIERIQTDTAELEAERARVAKSAARAGRRLRYLRLARGLRSPMSSLVLWPIGVLTIGPIVAGILCLVVANLLFDSFALAMLAFLVGATAGALALTALLYRPPDVSLAPAIGEADAANQLDAAKLKELSERLIVLRARHRDLVDERRELMASGKVQRAALLQREWKRMPEPEWEDFVVEVLRTLGASVERLPRSTEKDANLLARFGDRNVSVVTVGEGQTVNSGAIQNALAGQKLHGCERSSVIINRRLTGAAQDFARHNRCTAIGIDEFPDFVMGKIEL
jgi:hypothetical protein